MEASARGKMRTRRRRKNGNRMPLTTCASRTTRGRPRFGENIIEELGKEEFVGKVNKA